MDVAKFCFRTKARLRRGLGGSTSQRLAGTSIRSKWMKVWKRENTDSRLRIRIRCSASRFSSSWAGRRRAPQFVIVERVLPIESPEARKVTVTRAQLSSAFDRQCGQVGIRGKIAACSQRSKQLTQYLPMPRPRVNYHHGWVAHPSSD